MPTAAAMAVVSPRDQTETVAALVEMVRELRVSNTNQTTQMDLMRTQFESQADALTAIGASLPQKNAMDVGKIGKPEILTGTFDEAGKKWRDWIFNFQSWFNSANPGAKAAMKWSRVKDQTPITPTMIQDEEVNQPGLGRIDGQLHCALVHMVRDDSLRVVKNIAYEDSGLEAWRKLNRQYDPVDPLSNSRLLAQVQAPPQATSIDTLLTSLEKWEAYRKEYEDRSGETLGEPSSQLCVKLICPEVLRQHLDLNVDKYNSYALMRQAITDFLRTRISAPTSVYTDIDGLGKGKKGKKGKEAKGKKGKADDGAKPCKHCKKPLRGLHTEYDCWHNPRNPSPEAREVRRKADERAKGGQPSTDPKGAGKDKKGGKPYKGKKAKSDPIKSLEAQGWPDQPAEAI